MARKFENLEPENPEPEYKPESKEQVEQEIENSTSESDELTSWNDVSESVVEKEQELEDQIPESIVQALTDFIEFVHNELKDYTGFPDWALSETEKQAWYRLNSQIAPYIPIKYFGLLLSGIVVMFIEVMKMRKFMAYKKSLKETS